VARSAPLTAFNITENNDMTHPQWTRRTALQAAAAAGSLAAIPSWAQDKGAEGASASGAGGAASRSGEIRIGQSLHLSGPASVTIGPVVIGQNLAIEEVNRKGGINGRPVRLITLDDAYDPKKCVENINTLIDKEKVVALYGLGATAQVLATLPILTERKIPLVGTYSGSPVLRAKHHPYFFTTMASYRDEVVQMIRNLVAVQKTQIGLVYQNAPFGQLMKPIVEEVAKELGATLVGQQPLEASGSDAVACVQALASAKPQAVLFMAFGVSLIPLAAAVRTYLAVPLYCISISNSDPILAKMGNDARGLAFTQIIPYPYRQTAALTREFAASATRANVEVNYGHFFGYLNVRVLLEGIRRAGKQVTSASIVKGMESMTKYDMGGYPLSYGPNKHHGSNFVEITIVGPGGRWIR
jgi:branched-chain amino acid transport system substrate-binding protein